LRRNISRIASVSIGGWLSVASVMVESCDR
jgi:hypothetical protein